MIKSKIVEIKNLMEERKKGKFNKKFPYLIRSLLQETLKRFAVESGISFAEI